uniref:DUF4283 domain-containing protein n=1 Tax=Fagus sylvatica TaxID=28930 RepID=A0A2N9J2I4_FAGSY
METIEELWQRFSLTAKEEVEYDLEEYDKEPGFLLAAKFITHRVLNVEAVARTFKPLWRAEKGFSVKDMGENTLLFTFEEEADLLRVLSTEAWSYDKYIILFQRVDDDEDVASMTFSSIPMWVQIHGLPLRSLSSEVAMDLGASLGEVEPYDATGEERSGESNPRVRVRLDITKPLCRGRKVRLGKGKSGWLTFKYERLPNFCYVCGLLTHGDKDCGMRMKARMDDPHIPPQPVPPQPENQQTGEMVPTQHANSSNTMNTAMETEDLVEIPSSDPKIPEVNNGDFEEKLREIDLAINQFSEPCMGSQHANYGIEAPYTTTTHPPHKVHLIPTPPKAQTRITPPNDHPISNPPKAHISITPKKAHHITTSPNKLTRQPLSDTTNIVGSNKKTPTQAKWRRVTRQQSEPQSPLTLRPSKRIGGGCLAAPPDIMNFIVWNCRGLGNPRTVQELARTVRDKDPSAVFLIETWADDPQLESLRIQLHFANNYSQSHIDTIIDGRSEEAWRFTCFYGAPETHHRHQSWDLLRSLHSQFSIPWCCAGDFNEIIRLEEKQGRAQRPDSQMQAFREALDDCGFHDLGYSGAPFTWCNNRFSGPTVWERLDRALASSS